MMDDWIKRFLELKGNDRKEFFIAWFCVWMRRDGWKRIGSSSDYWARRFQANRDRFNKSPWID